MASSSSSMETKIAPKLVTFKFQGAPRKSYFANKHSKIHDMELGHINWNEFLVLYEKTCERLKMISSLIWSGMLNTTSHAVVVHSSKLIMVLSQHYIPK